MMRAGIYIHIPFCKIKCIYCDFYSITKHEKNIPQFVDLLIREIKLQKNNLKENWIFDTIFFGGGTPSLLEPKWIEKILLTLEDSFDISNVKEITLEANPGEAPLDRLIEYYKLGINRLSLGFQSLQPDLLTFLSRIHSPEDCLIIYKNARNAGFGNINIDMLFNIPDQSIEKWKTDLKQIVEMEPNHISAYSLTVEKNTNLYKQIQTKQIIMPSEKIDLSMFEYCQEYLLLNNYKQYEISNYAKRHMKCYHNLHYWNLEPYLAFGPSAHGYDGYNRWWNIASLEKYISKLKKNELPISGSEKLEKKDHYNELIFNGLRTAEGIQINKINSLINNDQKITSTINKWKNCLNITKNTLSLKTEYYKFADEIASDLMINN